MNELDALNRHYDALKEATSQHAFFAYFVDYLDHASTTPAFGQFLASTSSGNDVWSQQYTNSTSNAIDHVVARVLRLYQKVCVNEKRPCAFVKSSLPPALRGPHSIAEQLKVIRAGGTGDRPELDIERVKTDVMRLHNRFLVSLGTTDKPRFDPVSRCLFIRDKKIQIRRISNQYDVLRVVFSKSGELDKEWFFDDVSQQIDSVRSNERQRKYYQAFYQLNIRLAAHEIADFFIITAHSARINPGYLKPV